MLMILLRPVPVLCVRLNWIIMHSKPVLIYRSFLFDSYYSILDIASKIA